MKQAMRSSRAAPDGPWEMFLRVAKLNSCLDSVWRFLSDEPLLDVFRYRRAPQFLTGGAASDVEPLGGAILDDAGLGTFFAAYDEDTMAVLILEPEVDIRQEDLSHKVLDQVQGHLVFCRKADSGQAKRLSAVGRADQQVPALRVQETGQRLEDRELHSAGRCEGWCAGLT